MNDINAFEKSLCMFLSNTSSEYVCVIYIHNGHWQKIALMGTLFTLLHIHTQKDIEKLIQ